MTQHMDSPSGLVTVVGSVNMDHTIRVRRLPRPGETVHAQNLQFFPGGKGSNQAIAAIRLGARVSFLGAVGDDSDGVAMRAMLVAEGIDTAPMTVRSDAHTGRAIVMVDDLAENNIVVIPGANFTLSPEDVDAQRELLQRTEVLVAQLEVPVETVQHAAEVCPGTFVLNPAPAMPLSDELLTLVDILVVNETEYGVVLGGDAAVSDAELARVLSRPGLPATVVITLGAEGAVLWHGGLLSRIPTPEVDVVDTTGAGDTFVGALAAGLARGEGVAESVRRATVAASLSTQALGATSGMPTLALCDQFHLPCQPAIGR